MAVQNPQNQSEDQQIAQLKGQVKMFRALQFLMPLAMILVALCIPYTLVTAAPSTKNLIVGLLCLFAVMDFTLIRFMLLPTVEKQLRELEDKNS